MKRLGLFCIITVLLLCTLTSCIMIPTYKHYKISADTVSSIAVYDLRQSESHYSDFLETESPVYELPEEKIADFLGDLSEIRFSDTIIITIAAVDPSFVYDDWTVRVNYTDGSYELISCDGYGEVYDKNGEKTDSHHFGCEQEVWSALIEKYLPQEILGDLQSAQ